MIISKLWASSFKTVLINSSLYWEWYADAVITEEINFLDMAVYDIPFYPESLSPQNHVNMLIYFLQHTKCASVNSKVNIIIRNMLFS